MGSKEREMSELVTGADLDVGDMISYPPIGGLFRVVKVRPYAELRVEESPVRTIKLFGLCDGRRVERWVVVENSAEYWRTERGKQNA